MLNPKMSAFLLESIDYRVGKELLVYGNLIPWNGMRKQLSGRNRPRSSVKPDGYPDDRTKS